jgi:PIN domain nuclease of toxin-antitoxin system
MKLPKVEKKYVESFKNATHNESVSITENQSFTQRELNVIKQNAFDRGKIQGVLFTSILFIIYILFAYYKIKEQ